MVSLDSAGSQYDDLCGFNELPFQELNSESIRAEVFSGFSMKYDPKGIYILSNDLAFLEQKWRLIEGYTKKVDPNAPLGDFDIKRVKRENNKFSYYINIKEILPRSIRLLYGAGRTINTYYGNCHKAAIVAAGVSPIMPTMRSLSSKVHKVAMDELSSGDIVFLPRGGGHSFVFLDYDLCISMNGRGQSLEVQKTVDVLKIYGHSEDVLSSEEKTAEKESIGISRKNADWKYPEPFMLGLMDFYGFADDFISYMFERDRNYDRLCKILLNFKNLANSQGLDKETKEIYQELYKGARQMAPNIKTHHIK